MAKLYGEIAASALMTFDKSFARSNGQPLDSTEVFYSKTAAETYAAGDVAYIGQKIVVVETENDVTKVTHYGIEPDASLKELGSSPVGDKSTIVVAEDGTISLAGVSGLKFIEKNEAGEDVSVTYQPLLTSAGLTWVKPSATTVEGLATEIEGLKTRMANLETTIGDDEGGLVKDVADVAARVKTIEDDYLTSDDKEELTQAIATAKTEVTEAIMGEAGIDAKYDTLKEIADWILSDTTNSAQLITRVSDIEKDYLKGADKTELSGKITDLTNFVGTLPAGAVSTTVVAYIQEVVNGLKIGDYAKASELTALADRVTAIENKLKDIEDGAQVNKIESVSGEFTLSEEKELSIKEIAQDKVVGLPAALEAKVSKVEGQRLITEEEATKWNASQANVIESIKIGDTVAEITEKTVTIPGALQAVLGLVKGSVAENGITVNEDHTMTVNSVNVNKLVQTEGEVLVLDGGTAAG